MSPTRLDPSYLDWVQAEADDGHPLFPAATVVLLRERQSGERGVEVLLLRRNAAVEFAGGLWVFPGGRIDPEDHSVRNGSDPEFDDHRASDDLLSAARQAAVRESLEEADQQVDIESLVWFAHWAPPRAAPKRFATFFFMCRSLGDDVTIDGSEIHEHEWMTPIDALDRHQKKQVQMAPPTWVTLWYLSRSDNVDNALATFGRSEPRFYETQMRRDEDGMVFVWSGDAAYPDLDLAAPGPRHRISTTAEGWLLDDSGRPFSA